LCLIQLFFIKNDKFAGCVPSILQKLSLEKKRSSNLRRQVGELSCRLNGIGPTGGFCLDETKPEQNVGGNVFWSSGLSDKLSELFSGGSVLDLGAGLAHYEADWERKGLINKADGIESVRMYDGAENVEKVTGGRVLWADLTEPLGDVYPADWVLSLEVGEHIPAGSASETFIQNLHAHNKRGIVISWGVPGQDGHFHVNNLPSSTVIKSFISLGSYSFDSEMSEVLRKAASSGTCCPWFANTIYVFRNNITVN
jgi:hypothetical protein